MKALLVLMTAFALMYVLWGFFLAVMSLKHARDANRLTMWSARFGAPILYCGYLLDFTVNVAVLTVLLVELPRELLVTSRIKRHLNDENWRGAMARWIDSELLDPIDPGHTK